MNAPLRASVAYPASYYAATAHPAPPRRPLAGDATAEVCVVGGGYSGLSAAIDLACREQLLGANDTKLIAELRADQVLPAVATGE